MEKQESTMQKDDHAVGSTMERMVEKPVEKVEKFFAVPEEHEGKEEVGEGGGGSVLGAIKETIAEIGQTTTHFIVGQPRYGEEGDYGDKFEQDMGKKRQ
ncbi:hypothetical protein LguiA_022426 [Lonicera macranthoides]